LRTICWATALVISEQGVLAYPSRRRMTEKLCSLRLSLQNPRLRTAYREVRASLETSRTDNRSPHGLEAKHE